MINLGFIVVGIVVIFGFGGVGVWWLNRRSKYKFVFRVWSKDLNSSRIVKSRITVNKENKNKKEFTFKGNPSVLTMRDPTHWFNGKPERWVIADESGEYQYLSPVNKLIEAKDNDGKIKPIDDTSYMKTRLHPINRQLALEQFRNNQKRYDVANTAVAGAVFGAIMLGVLIMIGMIYGMGTIAKANSAVSSNIVHLKEMQSNNNENSIKILDSQREITNNLAYIYGTLGGVNSSIVRPVDGYRP